MVTKRRLYITVPILIVMFYVIDKLLLSVETDIESIGSEYGVNWDTYEYIMNDKNHRVTHKSFQTMLRKLDHFNRLKVEQTNPQLAQLIRDFWLLPPSSEEYRLLQENVTDFSKGQSAVVDEILGHKTGGFYIECGALDGEARSNTLFFERERKWEGVLIEASLSNFINLKQKGRKASSLPACLAVNTYPEIMYFNEARNRGRLIDSSSIMSWLEQNQLELSIYPVQCFPLYSVLQSLGRTQVDYLSLDVEGSELDILRTIPWNLVDISVITVEFLHDLEGKEALRDYVEGQGYTLLGEVTAERNLANDFVFVKKN